MNDFDDFDAPWTGHRDELYSRVVKRGRALQWQRRSAAMAIVAVVIAIPVGAYAVSTRQPSSVQTRPSPTTLQGSGSGTTSTSTSTTTTTTTPRGNTGGKGGPGGTGGGVTPTSLPTTPTTLGVAPPRPVDTDIIGNIAVAQTTLLPNVPDEATITLTNISPHSIRLLDGGDSMTLSITGGKCCVDAHPQSGATAPLDLGPGETMVFVADIAGLWATPGADAGGHVHLTLHEAASGTYLSLSFVADADITFGADPGSVSTTSVAG